MKRSKLWLALILIALGLRLSVVAERKRRRRRNASIAQRSGMVNDGRSGQYQRNAYQRTENHPIPPINQPTADQQHRSGADQQETTRHLRVRIIAKRRHCIRRKRAITFWIQSLAGCATIAIAGLTAAYVHYSDKQWRVMVDAQKAAVGIRTIVQNIQPNNADVAMIFTNFGHQIAQHVRFSVGAAQFNIPPSDFKFIPYVRPFDGPEGTLGPGVDSIVSFRLEHWSQDQFNSVMAGRTFIYLLGKVTYDDGYSGMQNPSPFCFWWNPQLPEKGFDSCPENNKQYQATDLSNPK
jgi:hypothetical protein